MAALALCAVPHVHAPAGGRPQVALLVGEDDACRSGSLRGRPYHLHAHRLDDTFERGPLGGSPCRERTYGDEYLPQSPRLYDKRVKNAQEAHEAIRPAGDQFRHPERSGLSGDQLRLYDLIWTRTVASQMADAQGMAVQARLGATSSAGEDAEFAANGRVISFPGFLRAYVEGSDDPEAELEDREVRLPRLVPGEALTVEELRPEGHSTQPPARYTEASLVKALEEMGVGRPSTYATIMDTVQTRGYAWKKGSALVPSWTAFAVVGLLEQHFANLVDYGFTAQMEEDLDGIARGDEEPLPWLTRFYLGTLARAART